MHLQENTVLTLGSKSHQMLPSTLYTMSHAEFEVAMSNGLGGDAFTRK